MKSPLNASEIGNIWSTYMSNSMAVYSIPYYLKKCEDTEVNSIIELAFKISLKILQGASDLLKNDKIPIPIGFSEKDLNINAPRLYSDNYPITHFQSLAEYGLVFYGLSLATATREDVRNYFSECISETTKLFNQCTDLLVKRGLHHPQTFIPIPERAEFVHHQSFLTGWLGERRPLNAIEINQLVFNFKGTAFGGSKIMSYSQIAQSKELRRYFSRGKEICDKHIEVFGSLLREEDLPIPVTYESEVTNSTESPFSDKLMLFMILSLGSVVIGRYGAAMGLGCRRDLGTHFSRLITETMQYLEDGVNLMIKNGWMEQPPQALDRKSLVKSGRDKG